jgi:hypothetical protein
MELEILRAAMTEQLTEQQTTSRLLDELISQGQEVVQKIENLEKTVTAKQVVITPNSTAPVTRILKEFVDRISKIVADQPKSVVHQWRILLFPETNAGQYYKIVFGRLIPWSMLFVGGTYLFALCRDYIQTSSRINERRYYYEVYQDAWNRLDTALGTAGHKKMQEVMQQAIDFQAAK